MLYVRSLSDILSLTENEAVSYLEDLRWPNGVKCAHCQSSKVYRLRGRSTRLGLYKCKPCRKQFTVTVGTIYHGSHVPIRIWLSCTYLICTAKKGISAKQISRTLGISYKTAFRMAHKIRESLYVKHKPQSFKGIVEMDETYVGGERSRKKYGRSTTKAPVVVVIERHGKAKTVILPRVNRRFLHFIATRNIHPDSTLMTDDLGSYKGLNKKFKGGHYTIKHSIRQYVDGNVYTNTAESYFSLIKRGVKGVYHHITKKHLRKYLNEFEFRWNWRKLEDELLVRIAVKMGITKYNKGEI